MERGLVRMKITITGEHEGKSVKIATWEYFPEVVKGQPIVVEEEIMNAIRTQMAYYIKEMVK
jgi:hypothetical protein